MMAVQNTQTEVLTTRIVMQTRLPKTVHYSGTTSIPTSKMLSQASPTSSFAIIQIFATFYAIYSTIFERFRASTNQPKCLPPQSTPRLQTPPWEPSTTLTASSCKLVSPGSVFALQTGSSNNGSERRHNYF